MATVGVKLDDGSGAFVTNCFPVRTVIKYNEPGKHSVSKHGHILKARLAHYYRISLTETVHVDPYG